MKKIFYTLITTVVLFVMTACDKDFITAVHNSSEPLDEYFINQDRIFQALVAAYDPLEWFDYFYQYNSLNMVSDIMADDIYCGGSNEGDQPVLVKTHFYTATPTDQCNQIWTVAYSGINRCCHVLERVDGVPDMSDADKNLFRAEATILKAYYYHILWKFWGNIPYYDENLTFPYLAEQIDHDQVYENIVTKIEEALALNILPMKASGNEGRVTKAMAMMLYADVVLYQNDQSRYSKALDFMKEIISSNMYSLVADFSSIWLETGEWGPESIWEINYLSEGGLRDWGAPIATGGSVYPVLTGIPGATKDFADGWGFGGVAKSAYDMYEEGDQRRDGGILNIETYVASDGGKETCSPRWETEGFYLLKYIARKNGNHGYKAADTMNYGNNNRIYRFAETLLNAAELSVLLGQDGSQYLKLVRDRAGCTDTGTDIPSIIEERHKEFVGEGKRYWDLIRTGMASSVLRAANHSFRPNDWTESKKYWPIPQSEMDKDPNLVQNNY